MEQAEADRYLERIGADRSTPLAALQRRHLEHVPFENLDIHLDATIDLEPTALFDKIVGRGRGGFCYEQNGLFALLLEALGMEVARVGARVFGADGRPGHPLDHMALVVRTPGDPARHLVDVGFGRFTMLPLRWDDRGEQIDPGGPFRLADTPDGFVDVLSGDTPQLRIDPRPIGLADAVPTCWWQQTSPDSHFTQSIICSRLDGDGRISIAGTTLIRTVSGRRTETPLETDDAVLGAYRDHFGIDLDRVPAVKFPPRPALPTFG